MMVVIAIITVMTGILLGNLPNFRDRTTLQLVAQEVAVTIRGAQVFGIGTRVFNNQFPGHGVYFCSPNTNDLCRKNFLLFSDNPTGSNKFFDYGGEFINSNNWTNTCLDNPEECAEVFTLSGNIEICDILFQDQASQASISFSRLYPDAFIFEQEGSFENSVDIYLRSARDPSRLRVVRIYSTGAISIGGQMADETSSVCPTT